MRCNGNAAGEGGLTNGRGDFEAVSRSSPLWVWGKYRARGEAALEDLSVGEGDDAIISMSVEAPLILDWTEVRQLKLLWERKVSA